MALNDTPDPSPSALRNARPEGLDRAVIKAEACVALDGTVVDTAILESSGSKGLDDVVLRTLGSWTFFSLGDGDDEMGCVEVNYDLAFRDRDPGDDGFRD